MPSLVLIRGIPGSGKSTFAKRFVEGQDNWSHIEADMFFFGPDGYKFDPTRIGAAHEWCRALTDARLARGISMVVSNTFVRRWEMQPYFLLAKKYNADLTVIRMENEFTNTHGVPPDKVKWMKTNMETL